MVRIKNKIPEHRTTYYYKPGQTAENTKVSERALALIITDSAFQRLNDYATENQRVALLAEREAKRIAALKEATYNMSKSWEDTAHNIQKRRRDELLSRKKVEEAERIQFMKEMTAKNALERAEVVKQARELLLYRIPQCRLVNRALLTSETSRGLNEQLDFQKSKKDIYKKLDEEYAQWVLEDIQKFHKEESIKKEAKLNKLRIHNEELGKQIEKKKKSLKKIEESIRKSEIEDEKNMLKEIDDIKKKELEEMLRKKESLNKMFLAAIDEKRQYELKLKKEDEFQEQSLKIYKEAKEEMQKLAKEKAKNAKEEKIRRTEMLVKRMAAGVSKRDRVVKKQEEKNEAVGKELEEKRKMEELSKIEEKKQKREKARLEMQQQMKEIEEEKEKQKKEEMDLKLWETLQRYKRDEFNKEWNLQQFETEKNKRLNYGKILKKQMAEKDAERKKAAMEEDDSVEIKQMIDKANEKVMKYSEKVLEESRGIRPLYPIVKTIEQFKREAGLVPLFNKEENTEAPSRVSKRRRERRTICTKPINDENAYYFA